MGVGLVRMVTDSGEQVRAIFDNAESHKCSWPGKFSADQFQPGQFRQLLLLRTLRPDKVVPAVVAFCAANIGPEFTEPPPFELEECHASSSAQTPLVFVLCPGQDPMSQLRSFAEVCLIIACFIKC